MSVNALEEGIQILPQEPQQPRKPTQGLRPPTPPSPALLAWEWSDQVAGPKPSVAEIGKVPVLLKHSFLVPSLQGHLSYRRKILSHVTVS